MGGFTRTGGWLPAELEGESCKGMAGSPKKIHVRRTSLSVTPDFACTIAVAIGIDGLALRIWSSAWFMEACGGWLVNPEEAQTGTPPPLGASSSVSAKLVEYTSWKKPFRQSMSR